MKKRKPIKKVSYRGQIVIEIDALYFKILCLERGLQCEISIRPANGLGTFHILPKGRYPRLRWKRQNVLLVNYMPYHFSWHHDNPSNPTYDLVERRIREIKGEEYREELLKLDAISERHTMTYLKMLRMAFRQELKELEE